MALQSPGVEVTVIDESFYTPAEPGTTPLIVVATAQDKTNGSGTGVASATTKATAGRAFKLTSQRDLVDLYGVPFFEKTASASSVHGGERNEYGLLAAYSLLGVSNAAFIVRADVDLNQLQGQTSIPGAQPADGTYWVNTQISAWGIQEWNGAAATTTGGQRFANKTPIVLTDADSTRILSGDPRESVGAIGDYAIVFETGTVDKELARLYYKSAGGGIADGTLVTAGQWVLVGSREWKASHPAVTGTVNAVSAIAHDDLFINNVLVAAAGSRTASALATEIGTKAVGVSAQAVNNRIFLYTDGTSDIDAGDSTPPNGQLLLEGGWAAYGVVAKLYLSPALAQRPHTQVPQWKSSGPRPRPTGSVWIKTTEPNFGARLRVFRRNAATASWVSFESPMFATPEAALFFLDRAGGGLNLPRGTLFTQTNANELSGVTNPATAEFKMWIRASVDETTITSAVVTGSSIASTGVKTFSIAESVKNQAELAAPITVTFTATKTNDDANDMAAAINSAGFANLEASVTDTNQVRIVHKLGGNFRVEDTSGVFGSIFTAFNSFTLVGTANFFAAPAGSTYDFVASNWSPLSVTGFVASPNEPLNEPADGQLWYNPAFAEVDIMVHNGNTWVGYRNEFGNTREEGPIVAASNPYNEATVTGDLWISTADLEDFPTIFRYNDDLPGPASEKWQLIDKTDQVTEEGVLFADARFGLSGADEDPAPIADLLTSNFIDFDCPDPALYPRGMLLWNLRRSGGNVKRYISNYVNIAQDNARYDANNSDDGDAFAAGESQADYYTDRWVTASPNNEDGSGSFGRKAQRSVVVMAMKSVVDTSEEIRDEERRNFNLIAAPGYPELMSNLVNLNIDRGITCFVVGDTPLRLRSDATTLANWGSNANLALDNGDNGIVTFDEYLGVFYPNGFTTDLSGANAVVPASHMMLRTIALSDNVSFPWFAPAGTRRGGITNATAAGYIDALTGEFESVALNEGQRDTLQDVKINPITFFNGVGLVNYGQKTRARNASALDRINVARLVVFLRSQLNKLARPFIFEPNDKITRDEIKQAVESLLLELVGLRALFDFAVVCDESNNTNARIDRNELYVDIAIEPVKAVEFIYIPLRVKNTGEI